MSQMKDFQYIIAEERRRAGLTQEALATRIGITPQAISKWENGVSYPDVTLFPVIAEILNIPIARLFGEDPDERTKPTKLGHLPWVYGGLPFACAHETYICYADKKMISLDETSGIASFEDGSEAYMTQGHVINRGQGEIRLYEIDELLPEVVWQGEEGENSWERELAPHSQLVMNISRACDIRVLGAEEGSEGRCRVSAVGAPNFLAAMSVREEGEQLVVQVESNERYNGPRGHNRITVVLGSDHANLFQCKLNAVGDVQIVPDFDRMEILINGSADLKANGVGEASFKINGAGDINLREIAVSADMQINGSGDISVQHCASPRIRINGSGDVKCGEVHGAMSAVINGSGDITCGGDVARLDLRINGSGDFHGKDLSVTDAEIKVPQGSSAEITIGQIRGASVEKLSRECTLCVGKRGI